MIPRLRLATCLTLLIAQPLLAQTDPVVAPAGAIQIGNRVEVPVRYPLAIAAFDGTTVPMRMVTGALDQRAWRLDGIQGNTLSLLQPLTTRLAAQGYKVLFTCQTTQCGGFDFRFGIDILPEPQMHVDLGDYQYLAALDEGGNAVSLLASRAGDQGFVQVTSVTAAGSAPVSAAQTLPVQPVRAPEPDADDAAKDFAPLQHFEITPAGPPQSPLVFNIQLMTKGSVPLDDLVFASGKADLEERDYPSLTALSEWLKAHPDLKVTLVGHTDATGTLAGNVALSKQRAAAVRTSLIKTYGATAAQIDAQGAGYLSPRATNQTPEGRTKNRRVEVMLTSTPALKP